jgi:hypothetical protein
VIVSFENKLGLCRRAGALMLIALATLAYGCGASEQTAQGPPKAPRKSLKEDDLYRWEGEGKAKRKVYLNPSEIENLLIERAKRPN